MNLQHLESCEVRILDHSETVQVDFVKNSKIFIGKRSSSCDAHCLLLSGFLLPSSLLPLSL
jgi:hypothetical protein